MRLRRLPSGVRAIARIVATSETVPLFVRNSLLRLACLAISEARLGIAAEQVAGILLDAGGDRGGERADRRDRG